jgi:hypothetical protein
MNTISQFAWEVNSSFFLEAGMLFSYCEEDFVLIFLPKLNHYSDNHLYNILLFKVTTRGRDYYKVFGKQILCIREFF